MTARVQPPPLAPLTERTAHGASVAELLRGSRYLGYTYAYPHKTAYRPLEPPQPLDDLWAEENGPVFLYLHVPFCEMRCGFCNLFTQARPKDDLPAAYVEAVQRQAQQVRAAVGPRRVVQMAFGGGTPTQLAPEALRTLLTLPERLFGASIAATPTSVETSPETATEAHLRQLVELGTTRVSIGIQSFEADELRAAGRPIRPDDNVRALDRIRAAAVPILNLDLIYGIQGQTMATWLASVRRALTWAPEELYLYPLYVRPLTGLGRRAGAWADQRPQMYQQARALLLDEGYTQVSMRFFRRTPPDDAPAPAVYRCQSDAMLGLGCGARSYTRRLHYASEWAVGAQGVKAIVADWVARTDFTAADYGFMLDDRERKTRHVLQSLLCREGLDRPWYAERFGADILDDFPHLAQLVDHGLATADTDRMALTDLGLGWSDAIGPWLYSAQVVARMETFDLR